MSLTGYGPSHSHGRLLFDGDERKYELWEVKFLGYLRLKKLSDTIQGPLADDASEEQLRTDTTKNADAFAELIQSREESVTDYMLRAETASTSLKSAGETISDSLLIAMIIKGLPTEEYKAFSTVVTQRDKEQSFSEFKVSLRSFEETQKLSEKGNPKEDSVLEVLGKSGKQDKGKIICYGCGKPGHKISECRSRNRWCAVCKNNTHNTERCQKKRTRKPTNDASKFVRNNNYYDSEHDDQSYLFGVGVDIDNIDKVNGILVDCGATTHIVHDVSKFVKFDTQFNPERHFIELADGKRSNNVAQKRGDAEVEICDVEDWASSEDRRSITGYGFQLSENGPLVSWKSRKQATVALSTCEAEYMSLAAAVQEAKFLFQLLKSFLDTSRNVFDSIILYCDNQGALALAKNPVQHQRSKHIDVRYHFVRSEIEKHLLKVMYVPSNDNLADIFTKPVTGSKMKVFLKRILAE
ncbi:uncharacterized protein LOC114519054 [Dendronephthya gigantea]|uniref:uncharacterized protein LOC114519054 n=1 Tax=Dendronephthya gigantea TaxID=151771 RepID=UPI00106A5101|nr:uncharacterized protein LOC114519054 [Dendronephthya gigantea]